MSKTDKKTAKADKKAAKAEAKAAKKANVSAEERTATKETVIKSITAVVCVIAICIATTSAIGKYGTALVDVAKNQATANGSANADNNGSTPVNGNVGDDATGAIIDDGTSTPVDDGTVDDGSTPATEPGDTTATNGSTTPNNNTTKPNADPTTYSKAQAVAYYNSCLKNSYKQNVTIKKSEQIKINVEEVTGGTVIKNVANAIVKKYATASNEEKKFSGGKAADGKTAESFALPSNLVAAGAKTATIKKSGSGYQINIKVVEENATLTKFPVYNKQCSYPLDLASVDLSPAKVTRADFAYPGTELTAVVDAKGRVTSAKVYMPLNGTGAGAALGITLTAKVSGSWNHTSTYTYA